MHPNNNEHVIVAGKNSGMNPRGRFIAKVAAGAAASLTGLIVAAPLLTRDKEAVAPALAAEVAPVVAAESTMVDVNGAVSYVQFDVQMSEAEAGSFIVEVHPGAYREGTIGAAPDEHCCSWSTADHTYCCRVMVAVVVVVVVVVVVGRYLSPLRSNMASSLATRHALPPPHCWRNCLFY